MSNKIQNHTKLKTKFSIAKFMTVILDLYVGDQLCPGNDQLELVLLA